MHKCEHGMMMGDDVLGLIYVMLVFLVHVTLPSHHTVTLGLRRGEPHSFQRVHCAFHGGRMRCSDASHYLCRCVAETRPLRRGLTQDGRVR
jgi:hypothetical protein